MCSRYARGVLMEKARGALFRQGGVDGGIGAREESAHRAQCLCLASTGKKAS